MAMENRPREDLIAALRAEDTVWIRLAGHRTAETWGLALLEITASEEPPAFRRETWLYEGAAFTAAPVRGSVVAAWLEQGQISHGHPASTCGPSTGRPKRSACSATPVIPPPVRRALRQA